MTFSKSIRPALLAALAAVLTTATAAFAEGGGEMQVPLADTTVALVGLFGTVAAVATGLRRR